LAPPRHGRTAPDARRSDSSSPGRRPPAGPAAALAITASPRPGRAQRAPGRAGHAGRRQWHAELNATRQLFAQGRLGIADLILIEIPEPAALAARRQADTTRRRRNFDLHVQLAGPLRDWYHAVEQLDPPRVRWELPATGIPDTTPGPRDYSTGTDIFDALISQLPAR